MKAETLRVTTELMTVGQDWGAVRWQPRFFVIWSGQAISLIGSALAQFGLVWWITQTTGSASALATAGIMALLPCRRARWSARAAC